MIKVKVDYDDNLIKKVKVTGHAGYDDYGKAQLLMVQPKDNSKWMVIGYVYDFDLSKYLPKTIYDAE